VGCSQPPFLVKKVQTAVAPAGGSLKQRLAEIGRNTITRKDQELNLGIRPERRLQATFQALVL
jgi:hypothetical protein